MMRSFDYLDSRWSLPSTTIGRSRLHASRDTSTSLCVGGGNDTIK